MLTTALYYSHNPILWVIYEIVSPKNSNTCSVCASNLDETKEVPWGFTKGTTDMCRIDHSCLSWSIDSIVIIYLSCLLTDGPCSLECSDLRLLCFKHLQEDTTDGTTLKESCSRLKQTFHSQGKILRTIQGQLFKTDRQIRTDRQIWTGSMISLFWYQLQSRIFPF